MVHCCSCTDAAQQLPEPDASLPTSSPSAPSKPTPRFLISPSRALHRPTLTALRPLPDNTPTGPPLPLEIISPSLPSNTGEWLWRLGRDTAVKPGLEAMWRAWREGDLVRLEAGLSVQGDRVTV